MSLDGYRPSGIDPERQWIAAKQREFEAAQSLGDWTTVPDRICKRFRAINQPLGLICAECGAENGDHFYYVGDQRIESIGGARFVYGYDVPGA